MDDGLWTIEKFIFRSPLSIVYCPFSYLIVLGSILIPGDMVEATVKVFM